MGPGGPYGRDAAGMSAPREFDDQVAWVVGASGEIGAAICRALSHAGAQVVASSRGADATLAARLSVVGAPATRPVPVDITRRDSVDGAAGRIMVECGRIDMLVNTTSVSLFGDFLELGDDEWLTVYQSKVFGYVRTMRAVIPHMLAQGGGRIVNMSGRGGHQPTLPLHLAGMSGNAAVNLMSKSLANSYGASGIRVNVVAPGPVDSPRYRKALERTANLPAHASHSGVSAFNTAPVSGRLVQAEEVAEITAFLLSARSGCLTGTLLQADGGSTAGL